MYLKLRYYHTPIQSATDQKQKQELHLELKRQKQFESQLNRLNDLITKLLVGLD